MPKYPHIISTLVYLIIVQDGINVQDGKIPKINKRAGWNKAVQVGIFQNLLLWKSFLPKNIRKLINVQDGIRVCRLDFFKKLISCAAHLLDRPEYLASQEPKENVKVEENIPFYLLCLVISYKWILIFSFQENSKVTFLFSNCGWT